MKEYLSTYEIMAELGISKSTVQRTRDKMRKLIGKKGGLSTRAIIGQGKAIRMRYVDFLTAMGTKVVR
ncbi:MAG: helix-turn-helix domain-containing protein [Firmicutes bacterium]|nr:helix-turn-helix domain-containing protein [Bacillota bacterium]